MRTLPAEKNSAERAGIRTNVRLIEICVIECIEELGSGLERPRAGRRPRIHTHSCSTFWTASRRFATARASSLTATSTLLQVIGGRANEDTARGTRHTRPPHKRIQFVELLASGESGPTLAQTLQWVGGLARRTTATVFSFPRSWLPTLQACRVVRGSRWSQLSDHNPVVADFQC